jgi:hypothetical protein
LKVEKLKLKWFKKSSGKICSFLDSYCVSENLKKFREHSEGFFFLTIYWRKFLFNFNEIYFLLPQFKMMCQKTKKYPWHCSIEIISCGFLTKKETRKYFLITSFLFSVHLLNHFKEVAIFLFKLLQERVEKDMIFFFFCHFLIIKSREIKLCLLFNFVNFLNFNFIKIWKWLNIL